MQLWARGVIQIHTRHCTDAKAAIPSKNVFFLLLKRNKQYRTNISTRSEHLVKLLPPTAPNCGAAL